MIEPAVEDYEFGARIAAAFVRPGVDIDDLRQIGRIAVWRASSAYDPARGVPWHAWAHRWASMAAWTYCRRPMREIAWEHIEEDLADHEAAAQPDPVELLLPYIPSLPVRARVTLLLLLCGCTAREVAYRLRTRYTDVLSERRAILARLHSQLVAAGVHRV